MNYYIYGIQPLSNQKFLQGYLALKTDPEGELEDFKFDSKVSEKSAVDWSWAYKIDGDHFVLNDINESAPKLVQEKASLMQNLMNQAEENLTKEKGKSSIANTTTADIKAKLVQVKEGDEPSLLELQLAMGMVLLKIAQYFESNPEELFDFPLFVAYKKKHKLEEDFLVEDFLLLIQNGFQASMAF